MGKVLILTSSQDVVSARERRSHTDSSGLAWSLRTSRRRPSPPALPETRSSLAPNDSWSVVRPSSSEITQGWGGNVRSTVALGGRPLDAIYPYGLVRAGQRPLEYPSLLNLSPLSISRVLVLFIMIATAVTHPTVDQSSKAAIEEKRHGFITATSLNWGSLGAFI